MRVRRIHFFIAVLLIVEASLSIYISNYTLREKRLASFFNIDSVVTSLDISDTGEFFATGDEGGSVRIVASSGMKQRWAHDGDFRVRSVRLTAAGDFLLTLDANYTLMLFPSILRGVGGEAVPLWTKRLVNSSLQGFYSSGGIPALVRALVLSQGNLYLIETDGGISREFDADSSFVSGCLSNDGMWISAVDSLGSVYLFRPEGDEPVWKASIGLEAGSTCISQNSKYVVAGGKNGQNNQGKVVLLSLAGGAIVYAEDFSEPVELVSISFSGERVYAQHGSIVSVLSLDGEKVTRQTLGVQERLNSFDSTSFSPYIVGVNSVGNVYLLYINRAAPLWEFRTARKDPIVALTQNGDYVFVADSDTIYVLANTQFSDMIPGSRAGWGVVFFSTLFGASLIIYDMKKPVKIMVGKRGILWTLIAFIAGVSVGILITRDVYLSVLTGGAGCVVGFAFSSRGIGLANLVAGSLMGCLGSGLAGFMTGSLIWFGGDERFVLQLVLENSFNGLRLGGIFGPLGSVLGAIMLLQKRRSRKDGFRQIRKI